MVCKLTQGVLRIALTVIRPCSGMLTLGLGMLRLYSGKSSSCSRLETKTEPAKEKINPESIGIKIIIKSNLYNEVLFFFILQYKDYCII
jgi:hypothetical protein